MEKVVRVGKMPGRIQEVLVQTGTSIREVLELAGLDSTGYEIKIDGQVGSLDSTVGEDTNLIVLAQQIKGA